MVRWLLVVTALSAGCNQLLGLDEVVARDASGPTTCSPLAFDANRYKIVEDPLGLSWQMARDACRYSGYDLAVLDQNDGPELANEASAGVIPFWLGVSYGTDWQAIDGCTPELDWAPTEPTTSAVGQCVDRGANGLHSDLCTKQTGGTSQVFSGLCETPRPSVHCLHQQAERDYLVIPGFADYPTATAMCAAQGRHLVEFDSTDEIQYVLANVAQSTPTFWLGAARAGGTFTSPTGCPQVFTWGPMDPDGATCVAYASGAMQSYFCNDGTAQWGIICELNTAD